MIRGEAWGNLYLTEKQEADEFTAADEQTAMVLADWAGIAIDNARLFEGVQARKNDLERAVQGLEATTTIVRAIGTETDVRPGARADRQARPRPDRGPLARAAARRRPRADRRRQRRSGPEPGRGLAHPDRRDRGRGGALVRSAGAHERRADDAQAQGRRARASRARRPACWSRSCIAERRSASSPRSTAWPARASSTTRRNRCS